MKMLKWKNIFKKIQKTSMDGLNSKMERREGRTSELEDRKKEITQSEQEQENEL